MTGRRIAFGMLCLAAAVPALGQAARSISASDRQQGAQAHPQLLEEYGGLYAGPQAAYVAGVGKRIAVQSGLSNSERDFTVSLLDSSVNNAFAVPGGYVYVTRQIFALMNDEAELAFVLGHEVGHVAARHSAKRSNASTITQVLATGIGILTGSSGLGQIAGYGAQLYTLRFSRSQEYQADDLGLRYLRQAGYDPYAAADMLDLLNRQTQLDAALAGREEGGVPSWASTHPNGADRVDRARRAAEQGGAEPGQGRREAGAFLAAVDGTVYGEDPAQGVVDGQGFRHPGLKIGFTAPSGFTLANGAKAVTVSGSGGQAQFGGGGAVGGGLDAYVVRTFAALAGGRTTLDASAVRRTTVNGLEAASATIRATSGQQPIDATVFAYRIGDRACHFLTVTPAGQGLGPFDGLVRSFRRLTEQEAAAVKPLRIRVVTVAAGDTIDRLAARMALPDRRRERFLVLNGMEDDEPLQPGRRVKIVVTG